MNFTSTSTLPRLCGRAATRSRAAEVRFAGARSREAWIKRELEAELDTRLERIGGFPGLAKSAGTVFPS